MRQTSIESMKRAIAIFMLTSDINNGKIAPIDQDAVEGEIANIAEGITGTFQEICENLKSASLLAITSVLPTTDPHVKNSLADGSVESRSNTTNKPKDQIERDRMTLLASDLISPYWAER